MPKCVASLWPFNRKLGLRFAVAALLLPIGADRITAMMPHHSRRAEANRPPLILQSPTQINVVARRAKTGIKAIDSEQRLFAVRHVAARNVFGDLVRKQDMERITRRRCHAFSNEAVAGWRQIGTTDANMHRAVKGHRKVSQPVAVGEGVVIEISDDVTIARGKADVARSREPLVWLVYQANRVVLRNSRGIVRRAVIDDNHFVIRVIEVDKRVEALTQRARTVVAADYHGNFRPIRPRRKRRLVERLAHDMCGRLRVAFDVRDAEGPVLYLAAGTKPFIGPGKDDRARRSRFKSRSYLPVERLRLRQLAMSQAVETQFGQ